MSSSIDDGFRSLYYTDCLPGQGLRGGAGFQFQAVSEGVSHEVMALVQRTALYEAPVAWMREQRAVSQYPPSLTHVVDEVFVTARGVYLGTEINGVREGNQFTHAIATAGTAAYGQLRPAQSWDAPWWSEKPSPTTRCDPVSPVPEPGPLQVDTVREWVLAQSDAEDRLVAVLSAFDRLHGPAHRRVLFVADDVAAAVAWIAAGTLLLPQARALRISFRAFAINPNYNHHDVLVLHPDWAGPATTPQRDGEFLVFNLVTGDRSEVQPTESARLWAPRFLRDDPYDVIDAVELAHRFALVGPDSAACQESADQEPAGQTSAMDRYASAIVVLGDEVSDPSNAAAVGEWLRCQHGVSAEDVAEPVIEAVLAGPAGTTALRTLDRAAHHHRVRADLANRLRGALLASEIEDIAAGRATPDDAPLPPRPWPPAERDDATQAVENAADAIAPERMNVLLRTATRFDVRPRLRHFRDGAYRFVRWWCEHPLPSIDPARWSCGPELVDLLRDELAQRLTAPDPARVRTDIRRHWHHLLRLTVQDPTAPLDAALCSAAVEEGSRRREAIAWVLRAVAEIDPGRRADVAWGALFAFAEPTPGELCDLLRCSPDISEEVASAAFTVLDRQVVASGVTGEVLDALALLDGAGRLPIQQLPHELIGQDARLREWCAAVAAGKRPRPAVMHTVSEAVLDARWDLLLDHLLDRLGIADALPVIKFGGPRLPPVLAHRLPEVWEHREVWEPRAGGRRPHVVLALAFLAASTAWFDDATSVRLDQRIIRWLDTASLGEVEAVERVLKDLSEADVNDWRSFAKAKKARRQVPPPQPAATPSVEPAENKPRRRLGWRKGR